MEFETIKFGVVGFSKSQFDKKSAYKILDELFRNIQEENKNKIIEIVSGYTNSGIPKIAYELADKYGFVTVGFSAQQALNVRSGVYPVAKVILKGKPIQKDQLISIQGTYITLKQISPVKSLTNPSR